jgi:hypothetical protein
LERVFLCCGVVLSCRVESFGVIASNGLFPCQVSEPSGDMVEGVLHCRGWCYGSWRVAGGFEVVVGDEVAVAKKGLGLGHLGCNAVVSEELKLGRRGEGLQRGHCKGLVLLGLMSLSISCGGPVLNFVVCVDLVN